MRYPLLSIISFVLITLPMAQAQEVVYLIRHAEQVRDVEDPPLTEAGQQRATRWASVLRDAGLDIVFTSKKVRTKQTGEPIAKALNVPMAEMSRRDVAGLVERVRAKHGNDAVLVVSHSRALPKLVKAFGYSDIDVIEKQDYDNLFVIVPEGENAATVLRLRY